MTIHTMLYMALRQIHSHKDTHTHTHNRHTHTHIYTDAHRTRAMTASLSPRSKTNGSASNETARTRLSSFSQHASKASRRGMLGSLLTRSGRCVLRRAYVCKFVRVCVCMYVCMYAQLSVYMYVTCVSVRRKLGSSASRGGASSHRCVRHARDTTSPVSICLSVCISVRLSICPSVYLSVCISVRLSICLSVYLSVSLSLHAHVYVGFHLRLYVYIHTYTHTHTHTYTCVHGKA
jgi:hypothetical protein